MAAILCDSVVTAVMHTRTTSKTASFDNLEKLMGFLYVWGSAWPELRCNIGEWAFWVKVNILWFLFSYHLWNGCLPIMQKVLYYVTWILYILYNQLENATICPVSLQWKSRTRIDKILFNLSHLKHKQFDLSLLVNANRKKSTSFNHFRIISDSFKDPFHKGLLRNVWLKTIICHRKKLPLHFVPKKFKLIS